MATQKVVINGSSVSDRQLKDFFRQIDDQSITGDMLQAFLERRNPFESKQAISLPYPTYTVTVDGDLSLPEMIKAGGYDWVNDAITPVRFPVTGIGTCETVIHLIHRGKEEESQLLIDEMDALGYRPATIAELLALGAKYPELQREFPIIALDSVAEVYGRRCVACLYRWDKKRGLGLCWSGLRWDEICRFAFVKKEKVLASE